MRDLDRQVLAVLLSRHISNLHNHLQLIFPAFWGKTANFPCVASLFLPPSLEPQPTALPACTADACRSAFSQRRSAHPNHYLAFTTLVLRLEKANFPKKQKIFPASRERQRPENQTCPVVQMPRL